MATELLWLKIANVRMKGNGVEFQVEGDASDERDRTWLTCSQKKPDPEKLYEMVLKALQDSRKASGKLRSKKESTALKISQVRVHFQ